MSRSARNLPVGANDCLEAVPDEDETTVLGNSIAQVQHVKPKLMNYIYLHKRHRSGLQLTKPRLTYPHPKISADEDSRGDPNHSFQPESSLSSANQPKITFRPTIMNSIKKIEVSSIQSATPVVKLSDSCKFSEEISNLSKIEGNTKRKINVKDGAKVKTVPWPCVQPCSPPQPKDVVSFASVMDELLNRKLDGPIEFDFNLTKLDSRRTESVQLRSKPILKLRKRFTLTSDRSQASRANTKLEIIDGSPNSLHSSSPKKVTFSRNRMVLHYTKPDPFEIA